MTTKELVGPVPTVRFHGGPWRGFDRDYPKVAYVVPRDTCDPRYGACTDHHVACDCREAEMAENLNEYRYELKAQREAFDTILAGHPTWQYSSDGKRLTGCMCTGCQFARALHIYPKQVA
jgi:hypothetical protein